ncbi:MAG: acyl-ACP--UDP-N-acetylglucosamine O-acyltransferase [Candidatus Sedimenticola endophacoides]
MSLIHPSAIIAGGARLRPSVRVGPYSLIDDDVVIGEGCVIEGHVHLYPGTRLGRDNRVCHGALLGCEPQDLGYSPEQGKPLTIGDGNHFKEGVNISRGVKSEAGTLIGDGNYFMCGFHAGHDCRFGNGNVFGPNSTIGGHVILGNNAFVSGLVAIHQFCVIGDSAMLAGCCKIVKDIPPYTTADGNPARIAGLNVVGLRRGGFDATRRKAIEQAYKLLYHSGLNTTQALALLKQEAGDADSARIIRFFEQSERGVTAHR